MQPDAHTKRSLRATLKRFGAWYHKHPARVYLLIALGLAIAGALTTMAIFWQQPQERPMQKKQAIAEPAPKAVYYTGLTGEATEDKDAATKAVTAIMIENSPSARPQSGLKDAEIVYESIAEGGITRFLALYQDRKPELVGPVRSLRLYNVDWLTPYNASVAHVGGSKAALQLVRGGGYRDIDQFFNAGTYWRATDRYAPHNVYTSFSKLNALNESKGYKSSNPKVFERTDDLTDAAQDATQVNIKISGPLYNSSYSYDPATKLYARSQAGAPHLDREAGQIQAKVVIAMKVTMNRVMEDGYRESIATSGSGEATLFQNGYATNVTWRKDNRDAQIQFIDAAGQPVKLARGTTWISAIPTSTGGVTWQ